MNPILNEILEIPVRANDVLNSSTLSLPLRVPYLGMGSSYFAPLAFKYMGVPIQPELASEYVYYGDKGHKAPMAVLLSQSGRSSEVLWCRELVDQYVAVSNYTDSDLCTASNVAHVLPIRAGKEHYSSSKTYVNTLVALFKGFGFAPEKAVTLIADNFEQYREQGHKLAEQVLAVRSQFPIHGMYVTGSGPNIGTAYEAALILSESTKLNFHGLPMAQYDHGPKETAQNSIVIQIMAKGPAYERTQLLSDMISKAGAHVFAVEAPEVNEHFSILNNIIPFNFMAYYMAEKMNIGETFVVGGKVTEAD
ncbi:SIS domain-containing protein [Spirosoma flavum]|uniref:Glutamine--fructose-6-phosphate aminotransferase [isomerizing] n=1 Tax=Spirosoma flavum TaxID=2048557 RepID=A0ABW6AI03_9BACT